MACLFLLKDQRQQRSLTARLEKILKSFRCLGGFSDIFPKVQDSSLYMKQAWRALEQGKAASRKDICFFYKDYGLFDFLNREKEKKEIFCSAEILEILDYDRAHGTPYIETLKTYLLYERNVLETAAALHIHRNTLTYRLEKIQDLFRLNLDTPQIRCRYLLSLLTL